jgi:TetR/AcrR family transcriptional regulator, transcriptional repressor for nem operon
MAGRPKMFDEKEVVRKASAIFWKKGYEGASAEELLQAMEIGKGSFYLHFKGGKKELYQKSLAQYSQDRMAIFNKGLEAAADKIDYIKAFLLSVTTSSRERRARGCYLGNGLVEMAHMDGETQEQASALLTRLESAFKAVITEAQRSGRLKTREDPAVLARYVLNLRNGLWVTARMKQDQATFKKMVQFSLSLLE